ncbi:hypothetical protein [Desulfocicer vacuolatum]|nr:hypothetical protein [Desulfocicer vacuolatum]
MFFSDLATLVIYGFLSPVNLSYRGEFHPRFFSNSNFSEAPQAPQSIYLVTTLNKKKYEKLCEIKKGACIKASTPNETKSAIGIKAITPSQVIILTGYIEKKFKLGVLALLHAPPEAPRQSVVISTG